MYPKPSSIQIFCTASSLPILLLIVLLAVLLPGMSHAACTNCTTTEVAGDVVHTFTAGSGTFIAPLGVTEVQYLVVGGGGGGAGNPVGNVGRGGGGAGGFRAGTLAVTPNASLNVTVGAGGAGGAGANGADGGNSVFATITSTGGGGGGNINNNGRNGGSGGGAGVSTGTQLNGGNGVAGQGNNGGRAHHPANINNSGGGGGGGAGQVGGNGGNGPGGAGGNGMQSNITGTAVTYAGGGGGSGATGGAGGTGGGGNGAANNGVAAQNGAANRGGGGGGSQQPHARGGNGGSGIVVVRYTPAAGFECPAGENLIPGLLGNYYDYTGESFPPPFPTGTPTGTRVDAPVDFNWGGGDPGVTGIGDNFFAIRWDGAIYVEDTGIYQFQTVSDDGVRLFVGEQLVIDNWTNHAAQTDTTANIALDGGRSYSIRLEYFENTGQAEIRLRWGPSGGPFAPIPAGPAPAFGDGLYHCEASPEPDPLMELRMDEAVWDGTNNEVVDNTGNGFDGTAQNGADTEDTNPARAGDPGTCGYGTFDGNNDYVQVNNLSSILNGTASLTFWLRTTQTGNDTGWQAPGITGVELAGGADDIFWGWIDASGRIGISVANDFGASQKSTVPINNGAWRHVVLTRDADSGATQIYIDGNLNQTGSTVTGVIGTPFSSIGRIEDTGGTPEYFQGDLDEVRVYDTVLTDSQVTAVYNSTHPCPAVGPGECVADFAVYALGDLDIGDRVEVNGVEVTGSGNAIEPDTAQAVTATPPLPPLDPPGFPNFSGPDVDIPPPGNSPIAAGDYGEIDINNNQTAVFDTGNGNDFRIEVLETGSNVTLNFQPGRYFIEEMNLGNDTTLNVIGGGPVEIFIGDALEANDRVRFNPGGAPGDLIIRMYNGTELEFNNDVEFTGIIYAPGSNTEISLNDRVQFTGGLYSGGEVEINNDVEFFYDAAAITAGRAVAECDPIGPDHYAIVHDGAGVTCLAEEITIIAHDVDHSAIDAGNVTLDLITTTGRGDWSNVLAGTGILNNGTAGDGAATYTFPGGEASVTLAFNYTEIPAGDSESFFFDVTDGVVSDLGNGNAEDPEMTFARTGFRFFNQTDNNSVIPTQIAGKPSNVAPTARTIGLQAIRSSDEDPTVCEAAFPDGESRAIELGAECRDPDNCAGIDVTINGTPIDTTNDNVATGAASYTPVALTFDADAFAPLVLNYADAGLIQLHAQYDIPLADDSATPSGDLMLGSSNNFVVRPFGFDIGVSGNPAATAANGAVFTAAGEDFDITVRAVVWQAADDGNNDGIPDGHTDTNPGNNADLNDNAVTPNFNQESTPEQATLVPELYLPAGGNDGALIGGTGVTGFINGQVTTTVSYNEVGIIEIFAQNSDYLNTGQGIAGASGHIGRFIPYDFDVDLNTPEFASACTSGANDFTYVGQRFDYQTAPVMTVTAKSRAKGNTTQNYTGAFFKLTTAKLDADGNKTYAAETGTLDTNLVTTPDPAITDNGDGSATLTFNSGTGFAFTRAAPEVPFDAEISLSLNVIDTDDVVYGDGSGGNDNPAVFAEATAGNGIDFADSKEQRWGRLRLVNASGSELLPLQVPVLAEYFDGTSFIPNTDDSGCTTLALGNFNQSGPLVGNSTASLGSPTLTNGQTTLNFSAPGAGVTGYIDVVADLAGAGLSYLQFDWDGDGSNDDNPTARATFGIFAGTRDLIYIREPW